MTKALTSEMPLPTKTTKRNKSNTPPVIKEVKGFTDHSIEKIFINQLRIIFFVEKNLLKTLQKIIKQTSGEVLRNSLVEHKIATEEHHIRIEKIFEMMNKKIQTKKSAAFAGLQDELKEMLDITAENSIARDTVVITMIQKMEHYEIATYNCLIGLAKTFGFKQVATLLQETLDEEKDTDQQMNYLSEINFSQSSQKYTNNLNN
jgi:ferritin-like metal-binding protein YciE